MDVVDDVIAEETRLAAEEEARRKALENKKEHITTWFDRIESAKKHDEFYRDRWKQDRVVARGISNLPVSTNLISAILAVLAAFLYAKNPDVSVTPSDSVDKQRLTLYREFAETLQVMVSRIMKEAGLKRTAKRWIRGAQTVGISWVKAAIQTRTEKEPLLQQRINDLTTQLENVKAKNIRLELQDEEKEGLLISEIESNIKAAEEKLEITVAEGGVLDYMDPGDVIVSPECDEVENYLQAPWITLVLYKTKDETLAITGWDRAQADKYLKKASLYFKKPRKADDDGSGAAHYVPATDEDAESSDGFYQIYEIWSLTDGVVYTLIDGCTEEWARPRYAPITGKRFYPVFSLAFHYVDGERYPESDVGQLTKLQEEYNETRTDLRVHRQRAKPGTIFNDANVDPESIKKITDAVTEEYIPIKLIKRDMDINQVFAAKKYAAVDVGLYDTTPIQRDMEKVSGAQEALTQASLSVEKTATEASIQEAGRGARTGARQDDLEDVLTDLSEYFVQLVLQQMDQADAERYAGPGALWMNLTTDQALSLFDITVKAGSTGKPRRKTDREAWGTLLPLILDLIQRIGDARMAGKEWAAKPIVAILKETLARADDTADISMFLPVPPEEEVQAAGQPDPETVAKTKLDTAGSIDKAASAVEKMPSLVFSPEVRALLGFPPDQEPTVDGLAGALQGQQQTLPPSPDPLTEV